MSHPAPRASDRLLTAAYVLAASIVGVPLLVGVLAQAVLHQLNPRNIELGGADAYQLEIGIPFVVTAVAMLVAIGLVFSRLAKREGSRGILRYPILIVQLQLGFTVAVIALVLLTPGLEGVGF